MNGFKQLKKQFSSIIAFKETAEQFLTFNSISFI